MSNPLITLEQYLMGRDKLYPAEYTEEVKKNAEYLLQQINAFLVELGISIAEVSSGFRPSAINASVANAAKKSAHQSGEACDLKDDKYQTLANKILANPDLLVKHNLYLEDPASTKGKFSNWTHLQTRPTRSGNRVFKP
jgi:hypothetical protein